MLAQDFNPSTREAKAGECLEFKVSLVYRVSSRTDRSTKKPCLKDLVTEQNCQFISCLVH